MARKTKAELSAIAHKAVATRKAREAEEAQRQDAQAVKRHKAALKAWKTRRKLAQV